MTRQARTAGRPSRPDETFVCGHCGRIVPAATAGTKHRNHCPHCLWSRHVDVVTGDRRSGCRDEMEPIAVAVRADGEWSLVHRCKGCGLIRANRIAADDSPLVLMSLAARPLARVPAGPA